MKKLLKKILGPAFPGVKRRLDFLIRKSKGGFFAINSIDKKLEQFVNYDDGFYVELGANDGITQSNSLYFELRRNWTGVLVEPTPNNYLLCREYRSEKNTIFCNACVSFDFNYKYVDINYANLMTISENLQLDLPNAENHLQNGQQYLNKFEASFRFGAVARTLNSILDEANAPLVIDFISLDVEGAELEVLKGIDFNKYIFKYILVEIRDLDQVESFLMQKNYILQEKFSTQDFLFRFSNL